jgi:hypothetical protein
MVSQSIKTSHFSARVFLALRSTSIAIMAKLAERPVNPIGRGTVGTGFPLQLDRRRENGVTRATLDLWPLASIDEGEPRRFIGFVRAAGHLSEGWSRVLDDLEGAWSAAIRTRDRNCELVMGGHSQIVALGRANRPDLAQLSGELHLRSV